MGSLISAFLTYFVLMLIIVAVGGVAITLGITLRKRKDANEAAIVAEADKL